MNKKSNIAALYSVSFTDDDSVLQEELRFKATFDGIRDRNFTKDFYITGKMNLLFETKTINFRFMSSYIRKVNRLWRTINMFNPVYFVWGSYNIKRIYYTKDFSTLAIPLFSQSKIMILSDKEIDADLLSNLPMDRICRNFAMCKHRDMVRKKHPDFCARICYLIIAGFILCAANSLKFFSEKDAAWTATGISVLGCEYLSFADSSQRIIIHLTSTPLRKTTYFQTAGEASVAKCYPLSGRLSVRRYTVNADGGLTLIDSNEIMQSEVCSAYYSPLLSGEGYKKGYRLYTDFGVYEIA